MRGGDKGLVGSQRPGKTARPRAGYRPPQLHPPRGHLLRRKRLSPAFLKKGASLVPGFPLRPLAGGSRRRSPPPRRRPGPRRCWVEVWWEQSLPVTACGDRSRGLCGFCTTSTNMKRKKKKKIMFSWLTDSFLLPFQRETGPYCLSSRRALHRSLQKITVLA